MGNFRGGGGGGGGANCPPGGHLGPKAEASPVCSRGCRIREQEAQEQELLR